VAVALTQTSRTATPTGDVPWLARYPMSGIAITNDGDFRERCMPLGWTEQEDTNAEYRNDR
jgi:hypothetical protein